MIGLRKRRRVRKRRTKGWSARLPVWEQKTTGFKSSVEKLMVSGVLTEFWLGSGTDGKRKKTKRIWRSGEKWVPERRMETLSSWFPPPPPPPLTVSPPNRRPLQPHRHRIITLAVRSFFFFLISPVYFFLQIVAVVSLPMSGLIISKSVF